ncbi:hypothetical protein ON010_g17820 [Phytophthora cinnamomi]|nr:hypothetical protein ON010_g17820 [Phytophthora cinnamomi]
MTPQPSQTTAKSSTSRRPEWSSEQRGLSFASPSISTVPQGRNISQRVNNQRVRRNGHRLARLGEELEHGNRLRHRQRAHTEKTQREEDQAQHLGASEGHHHQSKHHGGEHEEEQRVHRNHAAAANLVGLLLRKPVDQDASHGRTNGTGNGHKAAKDERHRRLALEEPKTDEDSRAERAHGGQRERVRRVSENDQHERQVAEDAPPFHEERRLGHGQTAALVFQERRGAGLVLVVRRNRHHRHVPLFVLQLLVVRLLDGDLVELVRDDRETADHEPDHKNTLHVVRAGPAESGAGKDGAVDVADRRATVIEASALERGLAHAADQAADDEHVVALGGLRDAADDDGHDPHAHAQRDDAEGPVSERIVAEDDGEDGVAGDEGRPCP